ncbi:hypothetical protein [Streptomyces sp. CB01881]|uniref:hypothetical protein n=1 Tax=Streptomyces sp. CB01881 TaxID=2078691 RepID=UPI001F4F4CCF|nr:hypothetical protein [Streptomyces sp. CB01881]
MEFPGTINAPGAPAPVGDQQTGEGELAYWVSFDEPQYDSSGDGPYRKAQIWARHLRTEPDPAV